MTEFKLKRIAFAGYAGAGKDEAAKILIEAGYKRSAFGDIIKAQLDPIVRRHFGFSAFTEDREYKKLIRRTLESWGEDNYDAIMDEFFARLPEFAVNTRLVREREAKKWLEGGGKIIEIVRPGTKPATEWERERLEELRLAGVLGGVIVNHCSIKCLHARVMELALNGAPEPSGCGCH